MTDNEFMNLETELKALAPQELEPATKERLSQALAQEVVSKPETPTKKTTPSQRRFSTFLALAASVLLVITLVKYTKVPVEGVVHHANPPVLSQNTWQHAWKVDSSKGAQSSSIHEALKQVVNTRKWKDPQRDVFLEYVVPQEFSVRMREIDLNSQRLVDPQVRGAVSVMARSHNWASYQDGRYHVILHSVRGQWHLLARDQLQRQVIHQGLIKSPEKTIKKLPASIQRMVQSLIQRDKLITNDAKNIKDILDGLADGARLRLHLTEPDEIDKIKGR